MKNVGGSHEGVSTEAAGIKVYKIDSVEGLRDYASSMGMTDCNVTIGARQDWHRMQYLELSGKTVHGTKVTLELEPLSQEQLRLAKLEVDGHDIIEEAKQAGYKGEFSCAISLPLPTHSLNNDSNRNWWLMKATNPKHTINNSDNFETITTPVPVSDQTLAILAHEIGHGIPGKETNAEKESRSQEIVDLKVEYSKLLDQLSLDVSAKPPFEVLKELPANLMNLSVNRLGALQLVLLDEIVAWKNAESIPGLQNILKNPSVQELKKYVLTERAYLFMPNWLNLTGFNYGYGTILAKFGEWVVDNRDIWKDSLNDITTGKELAGFISELSMQFSSQLFTGILEPFIDLDAIKNEFKVRMLLLRNKMATGLQSAKAVNMV